MKKLHFFISSLIIATSTSYAQKLEPIVVLDYDNILLVSSSPAGHTSPSVNPAPSMLNESLIVGKYVHRNEMWTTEEQQVGYKNPNIPDIDLRYYTAIEFLAYVPSTTNKGPFWLELKSEGSDFGIGDPSVQRENWSRQFIQQPTIPIDPITNEPMTDQWFKISYDNILSGRKLGMIAFGYRRGATVPSGGLSKEIVYFDNFIMNPSKTKELCLYRETFFLGAKENERWEGTSDSEIVLYPNTDWSVTIQKGADRWVGGVNLKSDKIILEWDQERDYNHSVFMSNQMSDITIEDIDISGGFTNLKLAFDVKGSKAGVTPNVEYKVHGGEWTAIEMGDITTDWSTMNYTISVASADKVSVRLSGKTMDSGSVLFDNLTIYGTDEGYRPSSIRNNEGVVNVAVYPNPVTDILMVEGEVDKIELYNAQGAIVYSGTADGGVNVSNLPIGIYVAKVFTPEGVTSTKVLKK